MNKKLVIPVVFVVISAIILAACAPAAPTEDPNAEITKIANTVQAQLTQIYLLTPSSTPTPEATATPTPIPATATPTGPTSTPTKTPYPTYSGSASKGDNAKFAGDVTVPDGTVFTANTEFTKTWAFTNTGSTTWTTDYKLIFVDGFLAKNNTTQVKLTNSVKPGETVNISVPFVAPAGNQSYTSYWQLESAAGYRFGDVCSLVFSVGTTAATPGGSLTPSVAPTKN